MFKKRWKFKYVNGGLEHPLGNHITTGKPEIYMKPLGYLRERPHNDYLLHMGTRIIGFRTTVLSSEDRNRRQCWEVCDIFCEIIRNGQGENGSGVLTNTYKANDKKDLQLILFLIENTLLVYCGIGGTVLRKKIEYTEYITEKIQNDRYLNIS